ncbi:MULTISPECIES: hypothetical protein [Streptomyces]|uniref:Uncharacterized protein n=1 Tax=Streptomyces mordarskii TaxID=1226758 RepID=A0ABP3NVX1_9ACTN
MARSKFQFNEGAIKKAAEQRVAKLAADLTRKVNALTAEYEGRPVDEVKPAIQDVWARETGGGSITDPELTQLAEQIAAGGRVSVELA